MSDLILTAAMPFKRKGTDSMKESEFIMVLSMDLDWFKPDTARAFVTAALEQCVISRENDMLKAEFNRNDVEIPMGFKPDANLFQERDVFEQVVERIIVNTGLEKQKIIARINKQRSETGGLFNMDVLGILMAREYGIEVNDLIGKAYQNLIR